VKTIEIVPGQSSRPDWAQVVIVLSGAITLDINNVVVETDRVTVNAFNVNNSNHVIGEFIAQGSTGAFLRANETGIFNQDSTGDKTTDIGPGSLAIRSLADSIVLDATTSSCEFSLTGGSIKVLTGAAGSIFMEGNGEINVYNDPIPVDASLVTSILPGSIELKDRVPFPDSTNTLLPDSLTFSRGDNTVVLGNIPTRSTDGINTTNALTNDQSILVPGELRILDNANTSFITPSTISTDGSAGFQGVNAPKIMAKATYGGFTWSLTSSFGASVGFTGLNDSTEFTLTNTENLTYAVVSGSFDTLDPTVTLISGTTVKIGMKTPGTLDVIYVIAY
jgi:hypothetical protein